MVPRHQASAVDGRRCRNACPIPSEIDPAGNDFYSFYLGGSDVEKDIRESS